MRRSKVLLHFANNLLGEGGGRGRLLVVHLLESFILHEWIHEQPLRGTIVAIFKPGLTYRVTITLPPLIVIHKNRRLKDLRLPISIKNFFNFFFRLD